jgi:hypothetical protein
MIHTNNCFFELKWSCPDSEAETTIILDDGTRFTMDATIKGWMTMYVGSDDSPMKTITSQRRINWLSGAQSGELLVEYTERVSSTCGDCAAVPPQRPAAPLTALLPMILGALLWRRRTSP